MLFVKLKIILYKNSNLARILLNRTPPIKSFNREDCNDFGDFILLIDKYRLKNHLKQNPELFADAKIAVRQIERIRHLAERISVPVVVVLLPDEMQINSALQKRLIPDDQRKQYDFAMPQTMLKEMFASIGVTTTIDLLPAFQESTDCLYMNDTHFNPQGQALAASCIAQHLKTLLP